MTESPQKQQASYISHVSSKQYVTPATSTGNKRGSVNAAVTLPAPFILLPAKVLVPLGLRL